MTISDIGGLAQALFAQSPGALFLFDPTDERLIAVNPAVEELTKIPAAELLARPVSHWFRRPGQEAPLRFFAGEPQGPATEEDALLRTGDEQVWVPVHVVLTRLDVQPRPLGLLTVRDISARWKREQEFQRVNTFLDSIVDNVPIMLFVKEAETLRFELINKAGEELLGQPRGNLMKKNDYDFFPKEEADFFTSKDREVLAGKTFLDIPEEEIDTPEGKKILHTKKIPICDERGVPRYLLGVSEDITTQKVLEAFVARNEKLASIGRLSAGIAHEINNPIAFVANNLTVLQRDCLGLLRLIDMYEPEQAKLAELAPEAVASLRGFGEEIDLAYIRGNLEHLLRRTRDGVDRISRIVQALRGYARSAPAPRQEVEPSALLDAGLDILQNQLKTASIQVEKDYGAPLRVPCVYSDINQVLLNLLVNACHAVAAMPKGHQGSLRLTVRGTPSEVLVEVADNGCGIPPEYRARLFDPFFTTKDVNEGTGLGLWISHNIITAHGGRFEVDSEVNQGTRMRIFLPRHDPDTGTEKQVVRAERD